MPSLWCDEALLPTGWARSVRLVLDGTRIAAVEPGAEPAAADERQAIVLPGMANLHSHAFQRGIAGLTERRGPHTDTFWTWRAQMYRFLERLDADAVEAIAAMAYVEMLESGYTRVGEFHYLHHDIGGIRYANLAELAQRIAAAAQETGIGLALLPVFYAHSGFGGREPHDGQKRFVTDIEEFLRLLEDCRLAVAGLPEANAGIAPHSLRAVTRAQLVCLAASAGEGPIHIHVAEQIQEVEECLAWSGRRPVQWLLDEFGLD
ncbi:MAG: amidohydrolase family protein, partial [Hyphomicrobiaceae bacterium]